MTGILVASLRPPLEDNWFYENDYFTVEHSQMTCPDPYDITADAPPPRSANEAYDFWQSAYNASQTNINQRITGPWITASIWETTDTSFEVNADIEHLLEQYGDGVYTIIVSGEIEGEQVPISDYSVFIPPIDDANEVVVAHVSPTPIQSRIELVIPTLAPAATNTPTATPAPASTPTPTSTPEIEVRQLEDLVHRLINDQRVMHGVDPMDHVEAIRLIAREHSEDMAARGYFSHESPEGFDPSDRAQQAGYSCRKDYGSYYTIGLAENIHQGWLFAGYRIVNGVTTPHNLLTLEQIAQQAVTG